MVAALAATLLLAQEAAGPDFSATFTADALASHLEGKQAYLVVGAGAPTASLAAAAGALEEGLRRSGKADLVMNGASLGPVADLDDQALVRRCAPLPVARVAVVRVFESAGEPPRAVVAVYDQRGTVQVAFSGQAGQPLAPGRPGTGSAGQGVPQGVAEAVLLAAPSTAAQEEYDRSYLSFEDVTVVTTTMAAYSTSSSVATYTVPRQGKSGRVLEGDELYRIVGREDLAAEYQGNVRKRTTIRVVGVSIAIGVPLIALVTRSQKDCGPMPDVTDPDFFSRSEAYDSCQTSNDKANIRAIAVGGLGLVGGVLVATWGAGSVKLHPIDGSEAQRLGDEYNRKLKARLGLARASDPDEEPRITLSLGPIRGGGMVGFALTF